MTAPSVSTAPAPSSRPVPQPFRRPRQSRLILAAVVIVLAALLPEYAGVSELTRVQQVLLYVMVAFGLNIGLGFSGEFAVAQPVVLGFSAYTAGVLNTHYHQGPWVTLPAAVVGGCLVGFALSAPGFRLRGWYLAITTFFAAVIFPNIVNLAQGITGGTNGLSGIAPLPGVGLILGSSSRQYWIILGITLVLLLGMYNLSRSTWGVILRGVRDAPLATEACGVNVVGAKALVSLVSSFPVAVAGWTWAHAYGVISTDAFSLNVGIVIVAGVVLGGMGSVWGPVIGTVIVEIVSLWIGPFSSYNPLVVGIAIIAFSIVIPRGLVQAWALLAARVSERMGWVSAADNTVVPDTAATPEEAAVAERAETPVVDKGAAERGTAAPHTTRDHAPAGAPGDTIFTVEGVRKRFSGVSVLEGVDLTLRRGEVVGLIGPNGSGKTTLLNVITGHIPADEGRVRLFDRPVLGLAPHAIAGRGVRRTFQVPRLIGELSVTENIRLGLLGARSQAVLGSIFQLPRYRARVRAHRAQIDAVCDLVGLPASLRNARVDGLPLGTRRVVEVARAVVSGPAIVCLDEPGAGLGGAELDRLGTVMRRVADAGSGVLVIEHNLDFVRRVTDRVVEMQDGRVVSAGAASESDVPPGDPAEARK